VLRAFNQFWRGRCVCVLQFWHLHGGIVLSTQLPLTAPTLACIPQAGQFSDAIDGKVKQLVNERPGPAAPTEGSEEAAKSIMVIEKVTKKVWVHGVLCVCRAGEQD
jgi:hypothetical protein